MTFSGSTTTFVDPPVDAGAALLEAADANHRARREAGAEQLRIASEWAFTHRRTVREHLSEEARAERDVRRLGASAYPVHEYAAGELALAWEMHPLAAQRLMADAVDLRHRLPHAWAAVQAGDLESWVARKIVSLTRDLDHDLAQLVDEQVADRLASLPASRLLTLVEARVVAADRAAAEAKWEQAKSERTVHLARETEHGTRNVFSRLDAADAVQLFTTVQLLARLLPDVEGESAGQRLARAMALLADPEAALDLLAGRDPRGGKAVVYVHTTPEQLQTGAGVARVEDLGPFTRTMLQDLLHGSQITLKPVIDLNDGPAADCYEIPADIAERVHLTMPADVFPFAVSVSRWLDHDHNQPFDPDGPPGQTRPGNLGKLNRRHHRLKTHAPGWQQRRLPGNRIRWTTPHGRVYFTDRDGTHLYARLDVRFVA